MNSDAGTTTETIYAIRRADGEPVWDEFSYLTVSGPDDWGPLDDDDPLDPTEYEMIRMEAEVVERRTYPRCRDCDEPAEFWGLCRPHAEEDDPDYFDDRGGDGG